MNLFSKEKKRNVWLLSSLGCAIAGAGCGIPFIPGLRGYKLPGIYYPRFVLASNDSGQELHIPAKDLIRNKEQGGTVPFDQVNMKWGFRTLKGQDALISNCKNGSQFYIGTHKWGSEYRLHNGKQFFLTRDNCCCNGESVDNNEKVKPITLNSTFKLTNSNGVGATESTASKLILFLSTCTFTFSKENSQANSDKWNLKMNCKGYTYTNSGTSGDAKGGAREQKEVSLNLDSSYYKHRYVKTVNSIQK